MVVDGGLTSREEVLATAEMGADLIGGTIEDAAQTIARRLEQRTLDPAFRGESFRHDPEADTYSCPAGKLLRHQGVRAGRMGIKRHIYRARAGACRNCVSRNKCCLGVSARTIVRKEGIPTIAAYVA